MYSYSYDTGKVDERGERVLGKTSNLAQAIKNLAAAVLKLLDIVDPVLAKIVELDIKGLLDDILNFEEMINTALSKALAKEGIADNQIAINSFIDFGSLAALGGNKETFASNLNPVAGSGGVAAVTRFKGVAGQTFVTLLRSIVNDEVLKLAVGLIETWYQKGDATPEDAARVTNIFNELATRCKTPLITNGKYDGTAVDLIVTILVDLLTDYEPGQGTDMFYQLMATSEEHLAKYGIKHEGYDWDSVTKDDDGNVLFTEAEVEETMDSLDSVLRQALPDVFKILSSTGTLNLSSLGVEDLGSATGLFDILSTIVSGFVYDDGLVTTVYNALLGVFGGTIGDFLPIIKEAGIDVTAASLYKELVKDKTANAGAIAYLS